MIIGGIEIFLPHRLGEAKAFVVDTVVEEQPVETILEEEME